VSPVSRSIRDEYLLTTEAIFGLLSADQLDRNVLAHTGRLGWGWAATRQSRFHLASPSRMSAGVVQNGRAGSA